METIGAADAEIVGGAPAVERRTRETLDALVAMAEILVDDEGTPDVSGREHGGARVVGRRLAELTRHVLGCRRLSIVALDPVTGLQHPVAVVGLSPEQERQWWTGTEGAPLSSEGANGAGEANEASEANEAPGDNRVYVERLYAGEVLIVDMAAPPFRDLPNPYGVRVLLIAPMRVRDQLVGMLALDHGEEEHHFTADEVELAQTVARFAALVIERDRLLQGQAEARAGELALREMNRRMDEFLSIASHELRSPFTSVKGNVQVALNRLRRLMGEIPADVAPRLDAVSDILARTDRTVDRAVRLIEDLLDLSRLESDHLELRPAVHDLAALVGEVVEEQRQAWPGRAITVGAPDAATPVEIDAERIRQVLTNYVTNALKYSDAGRPVAVTVAVVGSEAWVRVRDEGPGLSPEQQGQVWDRFRRVSGVDVRDAAQGSAGGLGLGLYISRRIVEGHHGRVGVESAAGHGATFWFALPLAKGAGCDGVSQEA